MTEFKEQKLMSQSSMKKMASPKKSNQLSKEIIPLGEKKDVRPSYVEATKLVLFVLKEENYHRFDNMVVRGLVQQ
jgi:hypothetical protein